MKRLTGLAVLILICLIVTAGCGESLRQLPAGTLNATGPLTLTWQAQPWSWQPGELHRMDLTIQNNSAEPVELTITLSQVTGGGRQLGQPVFTELNRRRLKNASQGSRWSGSLDGGGSMTLTANWTPAESLASVDTARVTATASVGTDAPVYQSASLQVRQYEALPGTDEIRLPGGLTLQTLCTALAVLALVLFLLTALRRKRLLRRRKGIQG